MRKRSEKRTWLLKLIAASSLSKEEIADKCGVSHRTLMSYIYGERGVSFGFIKRLAVILGIDASCAAQAEIDYIIQQEKGIA